MTLDWRHRRPSQSFIHQGILSDQAPRQRPGRGAGGRNPLFIKEFFLTAGVKDQYLLKVIVAILYSSRNSF